MDMDSIYIHTYMHACIHTLHTYHTIPYHTIPYHTIHIYIYTHMCCILHIWWWNPKSPHFFIFLLNSPTSLVPLSPAYAGDRCQPRHPDRFSTVHGITWGYELWWRHKCNLEKLGLTMIDEDIWFVYNYNWWDGDITKEKHEKLVVNC